jgi:hypothetical protein
VHEGAVADAVGQLLQIRDRIGILVPTRHHLDRRAGIHRRGNLVPRISRRPRRQIAPEHERHLTLDPALRHIGCRDPCGRGMDRIRIDRAARWLGIGRRIGLERTHRLAQCCRDRVLDGMCIGHAARAHVSRKAGRQRPPAACLHQQCGGTGNLLRVHVPFPPIPTNRFGTLGSGATEWQIGSTWDNS